MTLEGANDRDKLTTLCKKTYKEQAIWFLNASWDGAGEKDAENFWHYVHKCAELDLNKKGEGSELDELNMHRFLESFKNERTVRNLRDELRKVGVENFKYIPLTMFLIWNYNFDWHKLVHAPQGGNVKEIEHAGELLEQSQKACNEAIRLAEEATTSERAAKSSAAEAAKREAEAKSSAAEAAKREAEAKAAAEAAARDEANAKAKAAEAAAAEADLKKADDELAAALAELKAQEDAFNNKTAELEKKSQEGSTVQKSKAANELAQHLSSDPLPLKKAKLTTEAAKRKSEKLRAPFAEATAKAEAAAHEAEKTRHASEAAAHEAEQARHAADEAAHQAEQARHAADEAAAQAEQARQAAEDQLEEAQRQVAAAEEYLEEQKRAAAGSGQGSLWWLDRELQEQKKYMPQSKGGIVKK